MITCIAWERGRGDGHRYRHAAYLESLADRDRVFAVVPRSACGPASIDSAAFEQLLAPNQPDESNLIDQPATYGDVLANCGLSDYAQIDGTISEWLELYRRQAPDCLIADCAPMTAIAARILGIPIVGAGTGYECPPDAVPLPRYRVPWPTNPASYEQRVLDAINRVVREHGAEELPSLSRLFHQSGPPLLLTVPELDPHREERQDAEYLPITPNLGGMTPDWPTTGGPRLLYYSSDAATAERTLPWLYELGWPIFVAGALPEQPAWAFGDHVSCPSEILDLRALIDEADCVVSNGSHGVSLEAYLAGVPVVAMPNLLERYLIASKLQEAGGGVLVSPYDQEQLRTGLRWALDRGRVAPRAEYRDKQKFIHRAASRVLDMTEKKDAEL